MNKGVILAYSSVLLLSGCASSTFDCNSASSDGCEPVSYVYADMDEGFHDYRPHPIHKVPSSSAGGGDTGADKRKLTIKVSQSDNAIAYVKAGDPLLSQPITARILFTNWQDDQGNFNEGGYTYIKLKDSVWLMKNR